MNEEPEDKDSPLWKNWALMQAGPSGGPTYIQTPAGEVVEYAPIEKKPSSSTCGG